MQDRIEKRVELKAPVSRVWQALTNHEEFGDWFGVKLAGDFAQGQAARGRILHPGFEHVAWEAVVQRMKPERLFSFTWHPYAIEAGVDYSKESPTLVEFRLEPMPDGTSLTFTESGFGKVPEHRRAEAYEMNKGGWSEQAKNIEAYLRKNP